MANDSSSSTFQPNQTSIGQILLYHCVSKETEAQRCQVGCKKSYSPRADALKNFPLCLNTLWIRYYWTEQITVDSIF